MVGRAVGPQSLLSPLPLPRLPGWHYLCVLQLVPSLITIKLKSIFSVSKLLLGNINIVIRLFFTAASSISRFPFWHSVGEQRGGIYQEEFPRHARVHEAAQRPYHTCRNNHAQVSLA